MGEKIGKITETVGQWTNDREVEAKGRVEQEAADPTSAVEDVSEEAVEDEKQAVRSEHRDTDPS
ncbi:MAG: hypothetical protein M3Y04_09905 [Actinomycetota bacterium]|nr:hypothetical protein [Actinomycetota bacterium]